MIFINIKKARFLLIIIQCILLIGLIGSLNAIGFDFYCITNLDFRVFSFVGILTTAIGSVGFICCFVVLYLLYKEFFYHATLLNSIGALVIWIGFLTNFLFFLFGIQGILKGVETGEIIDTIIIDYFPDPYLFVSLGLLSGLTSMTIPILIFQKEKEKWRSGEKVEEKKSVCSMCGTEIKEESNRFCPNCGHKL